MTSVAPCVRLVVASKAERVITIGLAIGILSYSIIMPWITE